MINWLFSKFFGKGINSFTRFSFSNGRYAKFDAIDSSARVNINGVEYRGKGIEISGDKLFIDGVEHPTQLPGNIHIEVHGNVHSIQTGAGDIQCNDVTGSVTTGAGDIKCGDVIGNIKTGAGDVTAGKVTGDVSTNVGDIRYIR